MRSAGKWDSNSIGFGVSFFPFPFPFPSARDFDPKPRKRETDPATTQRRKEKKGKKRSSSNVILDTPPFLLSHEILAGLHCQRTHMHQNQQNKYIRSPKAHQQRMFSDGFIITQYTLSSAGTNCFVNSDVGVVAQMLGFCAWLTVVSPGGLLSMLTCAVVSTPFFFCGIEVSPFFPIFLLTA